MRDLAILAIHLLVTVAKPPRPRGVPAVAVDVDVFTRRIVGFGVGRTHIDGVSVCRMFNHAVAGQPLPKHLSTTMTRCLASTAGSPTCAPSPAPVALDHCAWRQHCRRLLQIPVVA